MREWDYLPLCEERIVKTLIEKRSKLDPSFYPSLAAADAYTTAGVFPASEPITCTYVDLDRLIETAGLSKGEIYVVRQLMLGYGVADIAEHIGRTRQTVEVLFRRAVKKICQRDKDSWEEYATRRF